MVRFEGISSFTKGFGCDLALLLNVKGKFIEFSMEWNFQRIQIEFCAHGISPICQFTSIFVDLPDIVSYSHC